jgi:hypothetical protein
MKKEYQGVPIRKLPPDEGRCSCYTPVKVGLNSDRKRSNNGLICYTWYHDARKAMYEDLTR